MTPDNTTVVSTETTVVAVLLTAFALAFALRRLKRGRPEFAVGAALAVAFGLRLLAAAGVSATGLEGTLRGGDENTYLAWASLLADEPFGRDYFPDDERFQLQVVLFALEMKYGGFTEAAMRVVQVGLANLGVLFVLAAVYDLAGPRASVVTAWILAFEPASTFFSSGISKESLMVLAAGLVIYGGSKVWRHLDVVGIGVMGIGCLIALHTRPYAAWFLISASAVLILHAALRRMDRPLQAMPLIYGVMIAVFLAAPTVIQATSEENLRGLQVSQDYSTREGARESSTGANSDNLALERVDFSTREAIFTNLPRRMVDVVTRPYPWQIRNANQQLGAAGSIVALAALFLMTGLLWEWRGRALSVVGPFLYPLVFLLMAYALSAGNAGTSFRYRTHLVTIGLAMLFALREHPDRPSRLLRARRLAFSSANARQDESALPAPELAATTLRG